MKKPVSLVRWFWASEAATLIPGSTDFHAFERQKNRDGPPSWLPEVPKHGYFDCIGGQLVAIYRIPVDHAYRLDEREKRLYFSQDPFPVWPDEEEDYDLFYFVHRILKSGRWPRVFTAQPQR